MSRERSAFRSVLPFALVGLLLLPFAYFLSMGPVARWFNVDWETTYAPVLWATDSSSTIENATCWYLEAWGADNESFIVRLNGWEPVFFPRVPEPWMEQLEPEATPAIEP